MFPVIRLPAFSCLCLYCVILSRLLSIPKAKPGWVVAVSCIQRLSYLPLVRGGRGFALAPYASAVARDHGRVGQQLPPIAPYCDSLSKNKFPRNSLRNYGGHPWWALRDSNPRPSACRADALNQLS